MRGDIKPPRPFDVLYCPSFTNSLVDVLNYGIWFTHFPAGNYYHFCQYLKEMMSYSDLLKAFRWTLSYYWKTWFFLMFREPSFRYRLKRHYAQSWKFHWKIPNPISLGGHPSGSNMQERFIRRKIEIFTVTNRNNIWLVIKLLLLF